MSVDMTALAPVGEFGSFIWCESCAQYGVELLQDADLPKSLAWGFSEIYTYPPQRLLHSNRTQAAYYLMVKDGQISGGDGAPEVCRQLPGFHVEIPWAAICNQSRSLYGSAGQKQRSVEEQTMYTEIANYLGREDALDIKRQEPFWPSAVRNALRQDSENGGGLHNIAATLQCTSPEFTTYPTTALGVPIFREMSDDQKQQFLELLGAGNND